MLPLNVISIDGLRGDGDGDGTQLTRSSLRSVISLLILTFQGHAEGPKFEH